MTATSEPDASPVFLLGLGAQKAGTTWLHSYLARYPEVDFGQYKEYHVWDALTVPEMAVFDQRDRNPKPRQLIGLVRARLTGSRVPRFFLQRRLQRDPERYFDYFAGILRCDGVRITGDVTPAYSALSASTLTRIREGFATRGIETRTVFLMRDPVERCLSAIRMYKQHHGVSTQGVDISLPDEAALLAYVGTPDAQLRTGYHRTLAALAETFPPEHVHVGIYEEMFEPAEVIRFSTFLGIAPDPAFTERKFNTTEATGGLDPEARRRAAEAFAPVYDYCLEKYPRLRDLWISAPA